jgi:helicase MOV-10
MSEAHRDLTLGNFVRCSVCAISILRAGWLDHCQRETHIETAQRRGLRADVDPEVPGSVSGHTQCRLCNVFIPQIQWVDHKGQHLHQQKEEHKRRVFECQAQLREAENDQGGISISHRNGVEFGIHDVSSIRAGVIVHLLISSSRTSPQIRLVDIQLTSGSRTFGGDVYAGSCSHCFFVNLTKLYSFSVRASNAANVIQPGIDFQVIVTFRPRKLHVGRYIGRAVFVFEDIQSDHRFSIARSFSAILGDRSDHDLLKPVSPYVKPPRPQVEQSQALRIVQGDRPSRFAQNPYKVKLGHYKIPSSLESALSVGSSEVGAIIERLPVEYSRRTLAKACYVGVMTTQLWVEEHQATSVFQKQLFYILV